MHKDTRQNKFWDKTQQCQSNFWFSTFYMVFGFLTHKNEKIDQKQYQRQFVWKNAKTNKHISNHIINKQTTKEKSQSIGSIDAGTCCNAYA